MTLGNAAGPLPGRVVNFFELNSRAWRCAAQERYAHRMRMPSMEPFFENRGWGCGVAGWIFYDAVM